MKIFVSIVSYRDPQLKDTIKSLLDNKSGRYEIIIGVFEQTALEDSLITINPALANHPSIRYKRIDPIYSEGVGWARAINALQVEDEDFYYQIDSHMRFDPDWDRWLINDWRKGRDKHSTDKILITCCCNNFDIDEEGNDNLHRHAFPMTGKVKYFHYQDNHLIGAHGSIIGATENIEPAIHICAGNMFTHVNWLTDVGNNPRIYFDGEEQWLTLMSFSGGYHLYHPRVIRCYHYIKTSEYITKQWYQPIITMEKYGQLVRKSIGELNKLLEEIDEDVLIAYHEYSGVDYINKRLDDRARSKEMNVAQLTSSNTTTSEEVSGTIDTALSN